MKNKFIVCSSSVKRIKLLFGRKIRKGLSFSLIMLCFVSSSWASPHSDSLLTIQEKKIESVEKKLKLGGRDFKKFRQLFQMKVVSDCPGPCFSVINNVIGACCANSLSGLIDLLTNNSNAVASMTSLGSSFTLVNACEKLVAVFTEGFRSAWRGCSADQVDFLSWVHHQLNLEFNSEIEQYSPSI